jgi:glycerate kinase
MVTSRGPTMIQRVSDLVRLKAIENPKDLALPKIIAVVDVRNPLLGQNGATRVFGPQKGVTAEQIHIFERALARLADVVAQQFGVDHREEPGAGAAGGLAFGLVSFCSATIKPGFDVVAQAIGLEEKMRDADVIIAGEGCLDRQTLEGKVPAGVAKLARKLGKPVYAIVGRADEDPKVRELFDDVYLLRRAGVSEEESVAHAAQLLRERALELAKVLRATPNPPSPGYGAAGAQRPTSNAQ